MADFQEHFSFANIPFFIKSIAIFFHSFIVSLWTTKGIAKNLARIFKKGHPITSYLPEHSRKSGTPSLGGLAIMAGIITPSFFWGKISTTMLYGYFTVILFACIGAFDDIKKLIQKKNSGISPKTKFLLQILAACIVTACVIHNTALHVDPYLVQCPIFLTWSFSNPIIYTLLAILVILSTTNAANITDGLDGLLIKSISPCYVFVGVIAFIAANPDLSHLYSITYIPAGKDIFTLAIAACGACSGFLWFNRPKALIFMGDTGSMALGGLLAFCFLSIKIELLLPIAAFVMLLETTSVIVQLTAIRLFNKKALLFAPLHHHLEQKGNREASIVFHFGITSMLFCIVALLLFLVHAYVNALPTG